MIRTFIFLTGHQLLLTLGAPFPEKQDLLEHRLKEMEEQGDMYAPQYPHEKQDLLEHRVKEKEQQQIMYAPQYPYSFRELVPQKSPVEGVAGRESDADEYYRELVPQKFSVEGVSGRESDADEYYRVFLPQQPPVEGVAGRESDVDEYYRYYGAQRDRENQAPLALEEAALRELARSYFLPSVLPELASGETYEGIRESDIADDEDVTKYYSAWYPEYKENIKEVDMEELEDISSNMIFDFGKHFLKKNVYNY